MKIDPMAIFCPQNFVAN